MSLLKAIFIPGRNLIIAGSSLLAIFTGSAADISGKLENTAVAWHWRFVDGKFCPFQIDDKLNRSTLPLTGPTFELLLADGTVLEASDFKPAGIPEEETVAPLAGSPTLSRHFPGRRLVVRLSNTNQNLSAEWRVILRDGSTYLRQELALQAVGKDVLVKEIVLFDQPVAGAQIAGKTDGSPVVAGSFFFGYEHPMAENVVEPGGVVRCSFVRNAVLKDGETLTQSCVIGTTPVGQLRRGFLAYLERERSHPYRPFLHYNSWFDIAWDARKYTEEECLDAISRIGQELVNRHRVKVDSFLFDDGWDNNETLWEFHSGLPNGFTPLKEASAKYDAGIGVWVSPFGGYGQAKAQRIEYASRFGFETNANGFSLAGTKYYQRFHDICLEMIQRYGVDQFKFDGLAAGSKASENGLTRDGDAMMRFIADLRAAKPDLYINQTTGTWPSPFWLIYVDSTWRGGADHDFQGKGSWCQKWMTYRDAQTYQNVVQRAPLYPLSSLMLHGVIYATNAIHLSCISDADFADQAHEFFGGGTQLQELYITPKLLDDRNWDDLAESAKWSRANANVLLDTHWIGGDPAKGEIYGFASWSSRKGILVLRNPDDKPATFTADIKKLFELPSDKPGDFFMHSPWEEDQGQPVTVLQTSQPHTFNLRPFQVLVLEGK